MRVTRPSDWHDANAEVVSNAEMRVRSTPHADWLNVGDDLASELEATAGNEVVVCYRHPVHDFYNWSAAASVAEAATFVRDHIDQARGEGTDLLLVTMDGHAVWVTNHDGEAFRLP